MKARPSASPHSSHKNEESEDRDQPARSIAEAEANSRPTLPLFAKEISFGALPEGALLGTDSLYVVSIRTEGPYLNVYGVEEACPVFPCPNPACGHLENRSRAPGCMLCGAVLDGVTPVHRRYQLHEHRDSSHLASVAHITDVGLSHPGLLFYRYFVERPYGSDDRYYVVLPDPLPTLASKLPVPQKAGRVMDWGSQLADALAYLHAHHICWQQVTADHIALRDRQAMWLDFSSARPLSLGKAEAARQKAQDVSGLASVMFYLAAGQESNAGPGGLPYAAQSVFERALGQPAEITTPEALAEAFREAVASIRRPATMRLRVGRHTDVGMVRDLNEDSLLVLQLDRVQRSISQPIGLFVVADGMGGHAAGDVASGLVIDTMAQKMTTEVLAPQLAGDVDSEHFDAQSWLAQAVQAANQVVHTQRLSAGTNMGTTLVAALVIGDTAFVANVGDSRAYLISADDGIQQITTDHSLVERLISLGQIKPDEARIHPQRNVIYRTVGDKEQAEIDFFVQRLNHGDLLLLCSDGLSSQIEDTEIWRLVARSQSPQEACERLVQAANQNGGEDNVTVITVQISHINTSGSDSLARMD